MNQQDNLEMNDQQPAIEDLTVNKEETAGVKGGSIYIKTIRFKAGKDLQDIA